MSNSNRIPNVNPAMRQKLTELQARLPELQAHAKANAERPEAQAAKAELGARSMGLGKLMEHALQDKAAQEAESPSAAQKVWNWAKGIVGQVE